MRIARQHLVLLLPLLIVGIVLLLAWALLAVQPVIPHHGKLSDTEVRRIEQLIADNSPDQFKTEGERELSLDAEELTLLATFMFANIPRLQDVSAAFQIEGDQGTAQLAIPGTLGPLTLYLNLQAEFEHQQERARLISLRAGKLSVPRRVMRVAEQMAGVRLASANTASRELAELRHNVNATALSDGRLHLRLTWEPEALSQIRSQAQQIFLSAEDRERILAYYLTISEIAVEQAKTRRVVSLQEFLPSLFHLAEQRSVRGDAIAENRNLLQALSLYVNNLSLSQLIGDVPDDEAFAPPPLIVTLHQRHDLSLHFVTAAAIAASAGAGIAEVLAHSKEVYDARQSTGFSFSDMTANIAGVTLGEAATGNLQEARRIQTALLMARTETDYMPRPRTDADGLSEEMLAEAFGDRTGDEYSTRLLEIETKIAALPIYVITQGTD